MNWVDTYKGKRIKLPSGTTIDLTDAAVLKAANYRSIGLLSKLGFETASAAARARFKPEPDEIVMIHRATPK